MAWTRVKNRSDVGMLMCRTCPSWLRHWENGTNQFASMCGALGCRNVDVVGARVVKVGGPDRNSYIVPICGRCVEWNGEFDVLWDLLPWEKSFACRSSERSLGARIGDEPSGRRCERETAVTLASTVTCEFSSNPKMDWSNDRHR